MHDSALAVISIFCSPSVRNCLERRMIFKIDVHNVASDQIGLVARQQYYEPNFLTETGVEMGILMLRGCAHGCSCNVWRVFWRVEHRLTAGQTASHAIEFAHVWMSTGHGASICAGDCES